MSVSERLNRSVYTKKCIYRTSATFCVFFSFFFFFIFCCIQHTNIYVNVVGNV